jgi:hypothetical protein
MDLTNTPDFNSVVTYNPDFIDAHITEKGKSQVILYHYVCSVKKQKHFLTQIKLISSLYLHSKEHFKHADKYLELIIKMLLFILWSLKFLDIAAMLVI